ncbi:DUF3040 domain-containing protein [Phycicoccus elongatus]|uniref:DUF3040 domain-containing protein n=1 Tax=Phycicoccus elongatus TaxID=101689 RepID=UPI003783C8ED
MPLSEHEQQMLEQMEQALASEDPRFAHQMRGGTTLAVRRRRLVLGILGVVIGLALRGPTPPKGSSTFMHKLDERWERRERGQ